MISSNLIKAIILELIVIMDVNVMTSSFVTPAFVSTKNFKSESLSKDSFDRMKVFTKETQELPEKILSRPAKKGDVVTIDYKLDSTGKFTTEPLFDTRGVVTFVLGFGNYLPGLHDLITGMTEGSSKRDVLIDAGWGERNPELVFKVPKDSVKGNLDFDSFEIGTELLLQSHKVYVSALEKDYIEIDANPPLAGASYSCSLKLLKIEDTPQEYEYTTGKTQDGKYHVATFALGCFWGGELAFMREPGVIATKVGYTQGHSTNPSYNDVCSGETGHAEAIQIIYDSSAVSFERLVKVAMERLGDSVYLINQVGNDIGTQYRHGVYYHDDEQLTIAKKLLSTLGDDCATEILPASVFYDAEDYHQQYLLKGGQTAKKKSTEPIRCYG